MKITEISVDEAFAPGKYGHLPFFGGTSLENLWDRNYSCIVSSAPSCAPGSKIYLVEPDDA